MLFTQLLLGLGLVGTAMAGCNGGSDGADKPVQCYCDGLATPRAKCTYSGFPMPLDCPNMRCPDLPCPQCGTNNCTCPLPPLPAPPPLPPPAPPGQCVVQNNVTFNGGNLFGSPQCPPPCHVNSYPNYTNSQSDCCQMCHETSGCVFWSFALNGGGSGAGTGCKTNKTKGCCWLKDRSAWYGRGEDQTSTSGSTHLFPPPAVVPPPPPPAPDPSTTYNFLAIADWGSSSATHVDASQKHVADAMGAVAKAINATQVFMLGDNFYFLPPTGPDEARFKGTFEDIYDAPSLKDIPFYAVAGNHDWGGNVSKQIEYSNSPQNTPLKDGLGRWRYPAFWYNVTQTVLIPHSGGKTVTLEFLIFDSNIGLLPPILEDGSLHELMGDEDPLCAALAFNASAYHKSGCKPLGSNPWPLGNYTVQREQFAWLKARMAASTADYLWVGAHHPVYSIGGHGPTMPLVGYVKPLLEKYEANYFNGHDHNLQHMREVNSKVNYVVTGAGMQCCYPEDYASLSKVPKGSVRFAAVDGPLDFTPGSGYEPMPFAIQGGFTSYRVGAESMEVVFHAQNGTVLYTTPKIMARHKTALPPAP